MSRARILLADDNASMLERAASLLSAEFEIVAMVRDGRAAIEAIERLKPDLAVFDVSMPVMTGLEAAAALAATAQPPRVVFLTIHEDEEFVDAARRVITQSIGGVAQVPPEWKNWRQQIAVDPVDPNNLNTTFPKPNTTRVCVRITVTISYQPPGTSGYQQIVQLRWLKSR